jgi:serine/threonine-protein kinase
MGVGAWLLGVGAATAGSLLAVSLLGQGIAPATSQQVSPATVTQALANETDEPTPQTVTPPAPTRSAAHRHKTQPSATPLPQTAGNPPAGNPQAGPAPAGPNDPASAWPTGMSAPVMLAPTRSAPTVPSSVLSSQGGTVVAECQSAGVYLVSWTPAQGYEVDHVTRGPAATAQVTFDSTANSVTMAVTCPARVPTASTTVDGGGVGGVDH